MPRSRFEQLIDAGLASPQTPSPQAGDVSPPRGAWQAASQTPRLAFALSDEAIDAAKPHLSARDLRRAYRDWQSPDYEDSVAQAETDPAPQPSLRRTEPSLPDLLNQLANHTQLTRVQLQTLRRQLARRLHPDLVTAEDRQTATAEMAKLNAFLDAALRARYR